MNALFLLVDMAITQVALKVKCDSHSSSSPVPCRGLRASGRVDTERVTQGQRHVGQPLGRGLVGLVYTPTQIYPI